MKKDIKIIIRLFLLTSLASLGVVFVVFNSVNKAKPQTVKIEAQRQTFLASEPAVFTVNVTWEKRFSFIPRAEAVEEIIETEFTSPNGDLIDIPTNISHSGDSYTIEAIPPKSLTPGNYEMNLKIEGDSRVYKQNFSWGVLALNPDKAIYKPGEKVSLAIGVLDETGVMVCDANVDMQIQTPNGEVLKRSVKDKTIQVHNQCQSYEFTLKPDYSTSFVVGDKGTYLITLSAQTKNGKHTIIDSIEVKEDQKFEVKRESATRIYPLNRYPMRIAIAANEDYKGPVEEIVPKEFAIIETKQDGKVTDYAARIIEKEDYKILQWQVDFKKGQTYRLSYIYDAPDRSPEFYTLGNLKLRSTNDESKIKEKTLDSKFIIQDSEDAVFTEGRYWQIANDAVGTVRPDGDVTTGWLCTSNGNGNCHFGVVDEASEITGDFINLGTSGSGGEIEEFSMTSVAGSVATVTNVDVSMRALSVGGCQSDCDTLSVRVFIDGSFDGNTQTVTLTGTNATHTVSFPGTWTGDDDLRVEVTRNVLGSGNPSTRDDDATIYQLWADVTYTAIDVSGSVFNAGTSTTLTECDADSGTHELSLRANGTTYTTSCSSSDGSYTFTGVIAGTSGSGMVVWIDDAQAPETDGALVIRYDGSGNSTNNTFYDNTVTITSDDTNGVTNTNMDTFDNADDPDIPYTVSSNNLTVNSGYELLVKIKSGVTNGSTVYAPGGTVTTNATGGDLHLDDNSDATLDTATNAVGRDVIIDTGATLTVDASTTVGGGDITVTGTLDTTSGSPTVTTRGTGSISGAGSKEFHNLTIGDGTTATTTLSGTATANGDVTVGSGSTFNVNADLTVSGGDFTTTTTGIVNTTSGTPTVTVAGTGNIGPGSGGSVTLHNLTVDGTQTLSGAVVLNNDLTINTGDSLALASQNLTISGGDITTTGTGTVTCSGCSAGTLTMSGTGNLGSSGSITAHNLAINGSQTAGATITANNSITVGSSGTFTLSGQNINSGGNFTNTTTGQIACSGTTGTVTLTAGGTLGGGSGNITFCNLATSTTGTTTFSGAGTNTVNNDVSVGAGTTLRLNSNISIAGSLTNATTGVTTYSNGTPTVTMTGTGSIGGGTTGAITFYNLSTSGTGTVTFTNGGTNTVDNNVSIGAGTTLNLNSNITITGNLTKTTTGIIGTSGGTPTVTINGTTIGGGSGAITFHNLTTGNAGTTTLSGSGTNTINNNLSITNGTFSQSNVLTVTGDISVASGATYTVGANLNVNGGAFTTTSTGSIGYSGTPTVTIAGTGNIGGGSGSVTFYNLTCNGSQTGASDLVVDRTLTVGGSGSLAMGANDLTVGSSSVANSGSIANSGTITQSSSATTTILSSSGGSASIGGSGSTTFYDLNIAPTVASAPTITLGNGASQTVNVTNDLTIGNGSNNATVTAASNDPTINVDGDFTISSTGTFTSTGATLSVAGNFANNGTFNNDSGTVEIDGSGTTILSGTGSPAITFHNFTADTLSKTLNFTAGQTFRVNGLLTLDNVTIDSTTTNQWFINHQGTESVTNTSISNSGCSSSTTITVDASDTNGGNNDTCWDFASVIYPNPVRAAGPIRVKGNVRIRD